MLERADAEGDVAVVANLNNRNKTEVNGFGGVKPKSNHLGAHATFNRATDVTCARAGTNICICIYICIYIYIYIYI